MNNPDIQYEDITKQQQQQNQSSSNVLQSSIHLSQFLLIQQKSIDKNQKKKKIITKSDENNLFKKITILYQFHISKELINLFRKPQIDLQHNFKEIYLKNILLAIGNNFRNQYQLYFIYLHLILAQLVNLNESNQFNNQIIQLDLLWNHTNIMTAQCILMNLKLLSYQPSNNIDQHCQWTIELIKQDNIYICSKSIMKLSLNILELVSNAKGHLDLYFIPYLINKMQWAPMYRCFMYCINQQLIVENYAKIFTQIIQELEISSKINFQKWYEQKLQAIIKNQFDISEIKNFIGLGINNKYIEKLLIGLLGWKNQTEQTTILLNTYYDNCDWQINQAYNPSVAQCNDNFRINYLIDDTDLHRRSLVICLKAPCLNKNYNCQYFTWHTPTLNEYISDDEKYLWVQQEIGLFTKSGFYDWSLFQLSTDKKHKVHKILELQLSKKMGSQILNKKILKVKTVKGRVIVHPLSTCKLQINQIFLDKQIVDPKCYHFNFNEICQWLKKYKEQGINMVYLAGALEKDQHQFKQIYEQVNASPLAVTYRTIPCKLMGGSSQFKKLIAFAKKLNIRIIIDSTTRVSSSHMGKVYEPFRLKSIDQYGCCNYLYGAEGRSIRYQQTMMLNYRKLQAWQLLLSQIIELKENYDIDGIYLDHGFTWPFLYELDLDQLLRIDQYTGEKIYTNDDIISGVVVNKIKTAGFYKTNASKSYSNPFLFYLCKKLWHKYPQFHVICQGLQCLSVESKIGCVIKSGPIPRLFKIPKTLSLIQNTSLNTNGSISQIKGETILTLRRWYEQMYKNLPKNSHLIQSTTSCSWPNLAYVFKQMTWTVIDYFFFLPSIPMTYFNEDYGSGYRNKSLNIFICNDKENKLQQQKFSIIKCINQSVRSSYQIQSQQENLRKIVGPSFGFNLGQIHKHYSHRRKFRQTEQLITAGHMITINAQQTHGIHSNVLSVVKWNSKAILLISINFNATGIQMHYNMSNLKFLFTNHRKSNMVVKIIDIFTEKPLNDEYYIVSELIATKIQAFIDPYKTIIWKISIEPQNKLQLAIECSIRRMVKCINSNPPKWIYSSIYSNQIIRLLEQCTTIDPFIDGLNQLYKRFIEPQKINFGLTLSKIYNLWSHKSKFQKLFGIFQLLRKNPRVETNLRKQIQNLVLGNTLGPIVFITPEIGQWSSVGGLGVMVDELSKQLAKFGQQVYIITPYYQYNKKGQTDYLEKNNFKYERNINASAAQIKYQFGIHRGKYHGVNYVWFHNPELFSRPYDGQQPLYVVKQLVFFALCSLQCFCQLKIFPSIVVTNDWMCGFVSAYVKFQRYKDIFDGTKFMHICHNLDPLYMGKLYPKIDQGTFDWLIQLPQKWYVESKNNKIAINPSLCALQTCDNWGTVSNSYKCDLLRDSPLAAVLRKHQSPFSFPNGVRKQERLSIINAKTPGNHFDSKKLLQQKYFGMNNLDKNIPLFSFIGRVTKQKGVHLIIDAVESLLYDENYNIHFIVGGPSSSKQDYGKYCADRMKYLTKKYPNNFWSNPDTFFMDGALANIGSDFAMMPSLFEPGGIVQHEFFSGGTPVVAFRTGGLKDTVFQFDFKDGKGNGFTFMQHELEDFKMCMKRAIQCFKKPNLYKKLRQNAFQSVIQEEDVARGWNTQFYRMQNKIAIDRQKVEQQVQSFKLNQLQKNQYCPSYKYQECNGLFWRDQWYIYKSFKQVLKNCERLKVKSHNFCFETEIIPRPKDVYIIGNWDDWKEKSRLNFDKIYKQWNITLKLKPGSYNYKYIADNEWTLTKYEDIETDVNENKNHIVTIQ